MALPHAHVCTRRFSPQLLRMMHQALALTPPSPSAGLPADVENVHVRPTRRRRRTRIGALSIAKPGSSVNHSPSGLPANFNLPTTSLERSVQNLKSVCANVLNEVEITNDVAVQPADVSDEQLFDLYKDLMQVESASLSEAPLEPDPEELARRQKEEDKRMISSIAEKLSILQMTSTEISEQGLANKLADMRGGKPMPIINATEEIGPDPARIVAFLEDAVDRLQTVQASMVAPEASSTRDTLDRAVSISLLSNEEWMSLIRTCIKQPDLGVAERAIYLMRRMEFTPLAECVDLVFAAYAARGDVKHFESFMTHILSDPPTEKQRDLHIKVHLVNETKLSAMDHPFPTNALALLHRYEASGHYAPIVSYTRVISALFNVRTSTTSAPGLGRRAAQAQAWDLFAHMRYVAHPTPDAHLYALMIRACGSFARPEPERALDLWTEMQESEIEPTRGAYEAIIRVCGRAGKDWLGEGIRLVREMGDKYPLNQANGIRIWSGLLEGCKRTGDLNRARWILAEAVRGPQDASTRQAVDEEMMIHVFHTYASYKPPFQRGATRIVDEQPPSNGGTEAVAAKASSSPAETDDSGVDSSPTGARYTPFGADNVIPGLQMSDSVPSFARLPPQTASDVLSEVRALMDNIVRDHRIYPDKSQIPDVASPLSGRFARVRLTTDLLNAYMSVFHAHASVETVRDTFNTLFGENRCVVVPGFTNGANERTIIDALERCAVARPDERRMAAQWAQKLWDRWEATERQGLRDGKETVGAFARSIERAHTAMRRVLIYSDDVDGALTLLRTFAGRYPPTALLNSPTTTQADSQPSIAHPEMISAPSPPKSPIISLYAKPPILSTRTVLSNSNPASSSATARPLVRLTSAVGPSDDRVPPLVGFTDVELLHKRLVDQGRIKEVGYIKWLCKAYTGALRKRRDAVLRATPVPRRDVEAHSVGL